MEGSYGTPDGDFHDSCVVEKEDIEKTVKEYLIPYFENWMNDKEENPHEIILEILEIGSFSFEKFGYGEYLNITIERV